jgi:hypothetical protein
MLCPNEMLKNPGSLDLLKQALLYGNTFEICGDFCFNTNLELNFFNNTKFQKIKTVAFDNLNSQHLNTFHASRREYLRAQLHSLCLLSTQIIFVDKFDTIAAAIAFARDEIVWYIKHFDNDFNGRRKPTKRGEMRPWHDPSFAELMWLVFQLRRKIVDNRTKIIASYVRDTARIFPRIKELVTAAMSIDSIANDNIGFMLQAIVDSYTNEIKHGSWEFQGIKLARLMYNRTKNELDPVSSLLFPVHFSCNNS